MLYSLAGLIIDIRFRYAYGKALCKAYEYHGEKKADFCVEISDEMIAHERSLDTGGFSDGYLEGLAAYREICKQAYAYDCMFMHCSALSYKGNALLLTAPSGTGKSTHARLWREHFGEDVVMINDDKPLLRFIDGQIYACGTPWDGKHHISNNIMVPVKAIAILSQGKQNIAQRASAKQALFHILNQTIRPEEPELMNQVLGYTEQLLKNVKIYTLSCTISDEAVQTLFNAIKENFDED